MLATLSKYGLDGIVSIAHGPETIAVIVSRSFCHRLQCQHGPIPYRWDVLRALFALRFWDVYAPERLRAKPCRLRLHIPCHFSFGVFHVLPSTPGVLLPVFSVTRLTAKALPESERVRIRCSSLTRRHCSCRVAFAIHSCSFRTRTWRACRAGYRGHTKMCIHLTEIFLETLHYFMQLKT